MREKKDYIYIGLFVFLIAVCIGVPTLVLANINPSEHQNQDIVQGTGTIIYLSFEGGFYGIMSDDGNGYDPINLPSEYKIAGLRVEFVGEILNLCSCHMWGKIIKIIFINLMAN